MKRTLFIPMAALLLLAACSENSSNMTENNQPAFLKGGGGGGNPAYHSSLYSVSSLSSGGELSHTFRQTGLGNFTTVDYKLAADFTVIGFCQNNGGNAPQGEPFPTSGTAVDGDLEAPKNGSINATLTLQAGPVSCQGPGNNPHQFIVTDVTWSNIQFCWGGSADATADATFAGPVPGVDMEPGDVANGTPLSGGSPTGAGGIYEDCGMAP
jgi:hypothetical protein